MSTFLGFPEKISIHFKIKKIKKNGHFKQNFIGHYSLYEILKV
jgi:hypothetical protein